MNQDSQGYIESVVTKDAKTLSGDLFIDCTGSAAIYWGKPWEFLLSIAQICYLLTELWRCRCHTLKRIRLLPQVQFRQQNNTDGYGILDCRLATA